MTAVIYARYSSAGQQETSIEFQIEDCTQFAHRLGYDVIETFQDRAKSATTDARPGFLRMIQYCAENRVDAVICWKHDRFARNRYDAAVYKSKLAKSGTRLLYCRETNSEGADSIIIDSVMEGLAEFYSANLSANVKAGNRKAAEKRWTLGVKTFGYGTAPDKTYMINEDEAVIVRTIFREYAAGTPIKDIIRDVVPGWGYYRIEKMLSNEKYIGHYHMYGVDDWCIPPIIDRETFDRCQQRSQHKKHAPREDHETYLLSGKVFCGLCGDRYNGNSTLKKTTGKIYRWYSCKNHKKGCRNESIDRDRLEAMVMEKLTAIVHSDEMIEQLSDEFIQAQEENATFLRACENQLADLNGQRSALVTAISRNPLNSLVDRLAEIEQEIEAREAAIRRERSAMFTREQIRAFFLDFRQHPNDKRWQRMLVQTFLTAVWIYPDKIIIQTTLDGSAEPDRETADRIATDESGGGFRLGYIKLRPARLGMAQPSIWIIIPKTEKSTR